MLGVKLFIILFLCTFFIFSFSHFGASAFHSILNNTNTFAEGTTAGIVDVSGKTETEAMQLVDEQLTRWLEEMNIHIRYKEKKILLNNSHFRFNIVDSVKSVNNGQKNMLLVDFENNTLENEILDSFPSLNSDMIDFDKLMSDLLKSAKILESENLEFSLENYLMGANKNQNAVINESSIEFKDTDADMRRIIEKLSTIEIQPNSQFSLLKFLEENGLEKESPIAINKLATAIYQLILPTNFPIIERYISNDKPEYAQLGFEAKVDAEKSMDLIFANPNDNGYVIDLLLRENTLTLSLKGTTFLNKYVITKQDEQTFKPKTIKHYSPLLNPNEKKVKTEGKEGLIIKVFREVYDENGAFLSREEISEDYYPPIHRIEVYGLINKEKNNNELQEESPSEENVNTTESQNDDVKSASPENTDDSSGTIENTNDLWGKPKEQMK
ncbi:VanW family protein [Cytobacillus dafuensis]|nr:G5 domain-containing protein [Cytobacillus dafuensis]